VGQIEQVELIKDEKGNSTSRAILTYASPGAAKQAAVTWN